MESAVDSASLSRIVTLLTDFGEQDGYVAAMKGVILGLAPHAHVVDASHAIPPQDIRAGAWVLFQYWKYYPQGTIHVGVVDPGVGTGRAILLIVAVGLKLIVPDNGLAELVLREVPDAQIAALKPCCHRPGLVSATFHGRDIFAYAAARLAAGAAPDQLADPVQAWVRPTWARPRSDAKSIAGEIIHIDRFGNAITNIDKQDVEGRGPVVGVQAGAWYFDAISHTYAEKELGEPFCLFGSEGKLEIAVNQGAAAILLDLMRGDTVEVLVAREV